MDSFSLRVLDKSLCGMEEQARRRGDSVGKVRTGGICQETIFQLASSLLHTFMGWKGMGDIVASKSLATCLEFGVLVTGTWLDLLVSCPFHVPYTLHLVHMTSSLGPLRLQWKMCITCSLCKLKLK